MALPISPKQAHMWVIQGNYHEPPTLFSGLWRKGNKKCKGWASLEFFTYLHSNKWEAEMYFHFLSTEAQALLVLDCKTPVFFWQSSKLNWGTCIERVSFFFWALFCLRSWLSTDCFCMTLIFCLHWLFGHVEGSSLSSS